jgi:AbrB family looped-hinge helix DNA binding protein
MSDGDWSLATIDPSSNYSAIDMETVTLSPKFQVVIPQAAREALRLTAGDKLRVIRYADRLEFIPVRSIKSMRGFLRGMNTAIAREPDRLYARLPSSTPPVGWSISPKGRAQPSSPRPLRIPKPPGVRHHDL